METSPFFFSKGKKFQTMLCPLCHSSKAQYYAHDKRREFLQCQHCMLVFVPPAQRPSLVDEKAIYDYHCNDPMDQGYRQFLEQLTKPLAKLLARKFPDQPPLTLLDYGSGPGPTLHKLLSHLNIDGQYYDPIYAPQQERLTKSYDVVTATEVIEHFHQPSDDFDLLLGQLLTPTGLLATMTKPAVAAEEFPNWHYKNDITHVSFYSEDTYRYIARRYNTNYQRISPRVTFFAPWL